MDKDDEFQRVNEGTTTSVNIYEQQTISIGPEGPNEQYITSNRVGSARGEKPLSARIITMASQVSSDHNNLLIMDNDESLMDALMCNSQMLFAHINNNDSDQLRQHLMATKDMLDVTALVNSMGYTPIHLATSKSQLHNCEILIDFVLNQQKPSLSQETGGTGEQLNSQEQRKKVLRRRSLVKTWLNKHINADDSFTALHFASFHGNLPLIRLLIKHGADIYASNKNGLNMLHVSAQGEAPVSLAYFLEKGLQIDSRDISGRTPMHHAANIGNGLWIGFAVAQGAQIDALDTERKTPLITCCKQYHNHRNIECLKKLISADSNQNARDMFGYQAIDYLKELVIEGQRDDQLRESLNVVNEQWSVLRCIGIKGSYKKQKRTPNMLYAYYILMSITFLCLEFTVFKVLRTQPDLQWLYQSSQIIFGACLLLCLVVSKTDPGYLKKDQKMDFVTLLDTMQSDSLCPDCQLIKTPRSRHCYYCLSCVDRFDHHCPWVNNCVGKGNFPQFYTFVFFQCIYLASIFASLIKAIRLDYGDENVMLARYGVGEDALESHARDRLWRLAAYALLTFISFAFLIQVLFLCRVQTQNLCTGQTTNERFGKNSYQKQHEIFKENLELDMTIDADTKQVYTINAIDDHTSRNGSICGNFFGMCCNRKVMHQEEILHKTREAYEAEHTLGWERQTTYVVTQASNFSYDELAYYQRQHQKQGPSNLEPLLGNQQ